VQDVDGDGLSEQVGQSKKLCKLLPFREVKALGSYMEMGTVCQISGNAVDDLQDHQSGIKIPGLPDLPQQLISRASWLSYRPGEGEGITQGA
jgi:hypothetical protein